MRRTLAAVLMLAVGACSPDGGSVVATGGEASSQQTGDRLVITCTEDETRVDVTTVRATAAGVAVTVIDETGSNLQLRTQHEDQILGAAFADPGQSTLPLAPGRSYLLCSERDGPEHMLAPAETPESVKVTVVADEADWKSPVIDECGMVAGAVSDFGSDPSAPPAPPAESPTPEEAVRAAFEWVVPTDIVERAGYQSSGEDYLTYRVRRVGRGTVAIANVTRIEGRWVVSSSSECDDVRR